MRYALFSSQMVTFISVEAEETAGSLILAFSLREKGCVLFVVL